MKRRMLAMLLVCVMSVIAFSGCGATGGKNDQTSASSSAAGTSAAPAEIPTIRVAITSHNTITDYKNNAFTKFLEENVGVNLEFLLLPQDASEAKTKLSLMLADGKNLPDIFVGCIDVANSAQYGREGYFVEIGQYLADPAKTPNYNQVASDKQKQLIRQTAYTVDGKIYGWPSIGEGKPTTYYAWWINKVWRDKLGLKNPTNLDELKQVLIAFRDGDPNGNGIKDEIPLYGTINSGNGRNTLDAIMNCFQYWGGNRDTNKGLHVDENGKVFAPFTTEEWREGLRYLRDLYSEGLFPDSVFTDTQEQWKATCKLNPNVVGITTVAGGDADLVYAEVEMIPLLEGPKGVKYTPNIPGSADIKTAISADTKYLDKCIELCDFIYNQEAYIIGRYGEEGVHWTRNVDDMIKAGIDESNREAAKNVKWAEYVDLWQINHAGNWRGVQHAIHPGALSPTNPNGYLSLDIWDEKVIAEANAKLAGKEDTSVSAMRTNLLLGQCPDVLLPQLIYTEEESRKNAEAIVNCYDYVWTAMAQFVKGEKDLDKDWQAYLKEMEALGLNDWIETAQAAYDRVK